MRICGLKSCLKSIEKFHHLHLSLLKISFQKRVPPFFGSTFRSFFLGRGGYILKINTTNLENQPIFQSGKSSTPNLHDEMGFQPFICRGIYNCNSSIIFAGILSVFLRAEVPFLDLIPAGIAEENMVKVLREKYDRNRQHGACFWCFFSFGKHRDDEDD